jgi:hypothetical protein
MLRKHPQADNHEEDAMEKQAKKTQSTKQGRKLSLNKDTLRVLTRETLALAAGGGGPSQAGGDCSGTTATRNC